MKIAIYAVSYAYVFAACAALSFFFATLGHPTALWLWRDMLGLLQ